MAYTKVVIIGGGFAGLNAAKNMANSKLDVWIIDKTNHHLFQPLLYQVASAALSPADIAVPIRESLSDSSNVTVIMGEAASINMKDKIVTFGDGDTIGYEYLILAPGARHSYFGKDEWEPYAPGLKTLSDALNLRERILLSFERAERSDSISEARKFLNFVIIGGGPTGVELAGAIAEIAYDTMLKNFRRIDTSKTRIYLIEGSEEILPVYPKRLSQKARGYLEKFGVRIITGKKVTNVNENGVEVEGKFIEASNVIWAAGNQASPLLKTLGVETDRAGRVIVEPDLSVPGHPEVFVLGDASQIKGYVLPGLASVAIQQGRYIAKILKKGLSKEQRPAFQYFDKGTMATIGKARAIGTFGKMQFSGFIAWLAWCFVHILYLIGFRNRLMVLTQWFFSYFGGQRGARLINRSLEALLPKKEKKF